VNNNCLILNKIVLIDEFQDICLVMSVLRHQLHHMKRVRVTHKFFMAFLPTQLDFNPESLNLSMKDIRDFHTFEKTKLKTVIVLTNYRSSVTQIELGFVIFILRNTFKLSLLFHTTIFFIDIIILR